MGGDLGGASLEEVGQPREGAEDGWELESSFDLLFRVSIRDVG